ncbi:hypothetical protein APHAL10511_001679 [Amanita phalloides]|nr:hypothetical protein APHAL10511_001679 [Amanita phalloides]
MCGFGDKDRRPLAPAVVAKLVVRKDDNTLVDSEEVDYSFFLVTVDLWSEDGKQEMNLVLHPSSVERFIPTNSSKSKRRGTNTSAQGTRTSGNHTPAEQSPVSTQHRLDEPASPATMTSPQTPSYYTQSTSDSSSFQPTTTYGTPTSDTTSTWNYPQAPVMDRSASYPTTALPSIQTFGRTPASTTAINATPPDSWNTNGSEADVLSYRQWGTNGYSAQHYASATPQTDPSIRTNHDDREQHAWSQQHDEYTAPAPDHPMYATGTYASPSQTVQTPVSQAPPPSSYYPATPTQQNGSLPTSMPTTVNGPPALPSRSHTYTRTLVGPLSASASRLMDDHRKWGIFFLFQDLSVRTEGTFRLRMRLLNVGAPPAPECGASRIHTDVSPVLAQTFTQPFTVYSAKRFPGVPDTTALSIAFGNQGQKLPLRNRHNKRRHHESDSDADSDDA